MKKFLLNGCEIVLGLYRIHLTTQNYSEMRKLRKQKPASKKRQITLSNIESAFDSNDFELDFLLEYPADRIFRAFKNRTEADQQQDLNLRKDFFLKSKTE